MDQDSGDVARVRGLIEATVPEIESGVVEIRGIARKPGSRCILVVSARDQSVDAVGVVVGNRGNLRVLTLIDGVCGGVIEGVGADECRSG
jgi:N utilization substance protein A